MADAPEGRPEWTIHVHDDDPSCISINSGSMLGGNDSLLRTSGGWRDNAHAAAFVAWVTDLQVGRPETPAAERIAELEAALRRISGVAQGVPIAEASSDPDIALLSNAIRRIRKLAEVVR